VFVENSTWTELHNVQMTSSTVQSGLSGCNVYTSPTNFSDDVTSLMSLQGVPQLTSSLGVPCADDSSTLPYTMAMTTTVNDISPSHAVSQQMSTLGISCTVAEDPALTGRWIATTQQYPASFFATQNTYQILQVPESAHGYPPVLAVSCTSSGSDHVRTSDAFVTSAISEYYPPSPPDSLSSVDDELHVTASAGLPPPYPAQRTPGAPPRNTTPPQTSPPLYPVRSTSETHVIEPLLTPVTRRPRATHEGCSTFRYNRKDHNPDNEKNRSHRCDYPGTG